MGEGRCGRQGLGVPEPFGLLRQFHVLAGAGLHAGDLVEPEAQHVGLLGPFTRAGGELLEFRGDGPQPLVRPRVLGERPGDRVARVPVERLPLPGLLEEPLLVGLPVHRHQVVGDLGEEPHGHAPPAQVGPGTPLGGNGTADQQRPVVELGPGLSRACGGRGALGPEIRPSTTAFLAPIRTSAASALPPAAARDW
ncbi:hypothetical protein SHIRM173S_06517 [Streptomyces hirsutus]